MSEQRRGGAMTESTDRELIELAAKAAGIELMPEVDWNPLQSDADRYRLAEKLRMQIFFNDKFVLSACRKIMVSWPEDEPDAARAITRAAAEIGKAMEKSK